MDTVKVSSPGKYFVGVVFVVCFVGVVFVVCFVGFVFVVGVVFVERERA